MAHAPYHEIPDCPSKLSCGTVLARLLDGLGFRFYWATMKLRPEDYDFRPSPEAMSISEIVKHVWGLVNWISLAVDGTKHFQSVEDREVRQGALEIIAELRGRFAKMKNAELQKLKLKDRPFWHLINGPLADALTHTGQINVLRRLAGNPTRGANVFPGLPPK